MATRIEWADEVWNPATGCTKVSAGCDHCYAETFAERFRIVPKHHFEQGFDLARPGPDAILAHAAANGLCRIEHGPHRQPGCVQTLTISADARRRGVKWTPPWPGDTGVFLYVGQMPSRRALRLNHGQRARRDPTWWLLQIDPVATAQWLATATKVRYRPFDSALLVIAPRPYEGPAHVVGPGRLADVTA